MNGKYGFTLESIVIGQDDLYRNEDGDLRLKPDPCLDGCPEVEVEVKKPRVRKRFIIGGCLAITLLLVCFAGMAFLVLFILGQ